MQVTMRTAEFLKMEKTRRCAKGKRRVGSHMRESSDTRFEIPRLIDAIGAI